jgi:hypothetical protein
LTLAALNPFNYSLAELSKAITALIFFIGYVVTLFIFVPPGLIVAIAAVVPPAFGVVMVFVKGNHDADAFNKAVVQLQTAVTTIVVYFVAVPASTTNKITMAIGALASVVAVLWKANAPIESPAEPPAARGRLPRDSI